MVKAPAKKLKKSAVKPVAKPTAKRQAATSAELAPESPQVVPAAECNPSPDSRVVTAKNLLDTKPFNQAIAKGNAMINEGKSKAEAARAIFDLLKDQPRDSVIEAFIKGATITPKGAPTYYYNVFRKFKRDQIKATQAQT